MSEPAAAAPAAAPAADVPATVINVLGIPLPLSHALLMLSLVAFCALLIKWHWSSTAKNSFDLSDAFKNEKTGKASFDAILTSFFAILAFWYVVTRTLANDHDVGARLIDVLGIFVAYRGARQIATTAADAYVSKPAAPPAPAGDNVAQQVNLEAPAPLAVTPPPAPPAEGKKPLQRKAKGGE